MSNPVQTQANTAQEYPKVGFSWSDDPLFWLSEIKNHPKIMSPADILSTVCTTSPSKNDAKIKVKIG